MKLKRYIARYIAFVWLEYTAEGGWNDLISGGVGASGKLLVHSWDNLEEAEDAVRKKIAGSIVDERYTYQIVDLHTGQVVDGDGSGC